MRLFVAFLLDDAVRSGLTALCRGLSRRCDDVRWTPKELWHVTVKFLGDVPDDDVGSVTEALRVGAARSKPFPMTVQGCGCFPSRGLVRIVWAGAVDDSGAMVETARAINSELQAVGFSSEARPWGAHITIGRVREDRSGGRLRTVVDAARLAPVSQRVDSVALMSSVLSSGGARYAPVCVVSLG